MGTYTAKARCPDCKPGVFGLSRSVTYSAHHTLNIRMKTCSSCKLEKELSSFHKNPNTKSGLGSQCKSCDNAGRRAKTREKKKKLVDMLGGKCQVCGYSKCLEALDFHHVQEDKENAVSSIMKSSFDKILKEAEKCILLCANCHREHHANDKEEINYNGKIRSL